MVPLAPVLFWSCGEKQKLASAARKRQVGHNDEGDNPPWGNAKQGNWTREMSSKMAKLLAQREIIDQLGHLLHF